MRMWMPGVTAGLLLLQACASINVSVKKGTAQAPSNVALLLSIEEAQNSQPVSGITAQSFKVYEDGKLLPAAEIRQTLVPVNDKVDHFTLLMIDLGLGGGAMIEQVIAAARVFSERITTHHKIAVFGFDGRVDLTELVDFTQEIPVVEKGLKALAKGPEDPSTNLHGAVAAALAVLQERTGKSGKPVRLANLVILTRGPDRAARLTSEALDRQLEAASVQRFMIWLSGDAPDYKIKKIGKDGFFTASLPPAGDGAAAPTGDGSAAPTGDGSAAPTTPGEGAAPEQPSSQAPPTSKYSGKDPAPVEPPATGAQDRNGTPAEGGAGGAPAEKKNTAKDPPAAASSPAGSAAGMTLADAFATIARRIEGGIKKLFLLSYCSPLRAGAHRVRVEVKSGDLSGAAGYSFKADGFGPGCDPARVPSF